MSVLSFVSQNSFFLLQDNEEFKKKRIAGLVKVGFRLNLLNFYCCSIL